MPPPYRHLAAILFTDIVGFTALMQQNEESAMGLIRRYHAVMNDSANSHNGEVVNDYGDGSLSLFHSATEAVACAIEVQQLLRVDPSVPLRIGLHVGEVLMENGKVLGDAVNIASRIQSLGYANCILFSREICDKIRNHPEFIVAPLGSFHFKNVDQPMEI